MEIEILHAGDYPVSNWSGGTTTQLYIYPQGADYAKRDFTFRLSSATVECVFSRFTALPGVQREIMMLEGEIDMIVDGVASHLKQYEKQSFGGASDTTSAGQAVDFNLMLIGAEGAINPLEIEQQADVECAAEFTFIFMDKGECAASTNGKGYQLAEKSLMMCRGRGVVALTAEYAAHCIITEITVRK